MKTRDHSKYDDVEKKRTWGPGRIYHAQSHEDTWAPGSRENANQTIRTQSKWTVYRPRFWIQTTGILMIVPKRFGFLLEFYFL